MEILIQLPATCSLFFILSSLILYAQPSLWIFQHHYSLLNIIFQNTYITKSERPVCCEIIYMSYLLRLTPSLVPRPHGYEASSPFDDETSAQYIILLHRNCMDMHYYYFVTGKTCELTSLVVTVHAWTEFSHARASLLLWGIVSQ